MTRLIETTAEEPWELMPLAYARLQVWGIPEEEALEEMETFFNLSEHEAIEALWYSYRIKLLGIG